MTPLVPTLAANPIAPAIALVHGLPPEMLAAAIGALVGAALFGVVVGAVAISRRRSRPDVLATPAVVFVPPYPVLAAAAPSRPGFVPSSALSARALSKLGYAVDRFDGAEEPDAIPCELAPALSSASDVETGPASAVTITVAAELTSSSRLAAVPIADLDLDDAPTELCEPSFDVAQPHI